MKKSRNRTIVLYGIINGDIFSIKTIYTVRQVRKVFSRYNLKMVVLGEL